MHRRMSQMRKQVSGGRVEVKRERNHWKVKAGRGAERVVRWENRRGRRAET